MTHLTDAQEWAGNGSMAGQLQALNPNPLPPIPYTLYNGSTAGQLQTLIPEPLTPKP